MQISPLGTVINTGIYNSIHAWSPYVLLLTAPTILSLIQAMRLVLKLVVYLVSKDLEERQGVHWDVSVVAVQNSCLPAAKPQHGMCQCLTVLAQLERVAQCTHSLYNVTKPVIIANTHHKWLSLHFLGSQFMRFECSYIHNGLLIFGKFDCISLTAKQICNKKYS